MQSASSTNIHSDDENSFYNAFNYFFNSNCHGGGSLVCRAIKEKLQQDSSFVRKKTKNANKFTIKK